MDDSEIPDAETLLERMREGGLSIVHSMFCTIHRRSEERPDGYTGEELDQIAHDLHAQDVQRWRAELQSRLPSKSD